MAVTIEIQGRLVGFCRSLRAALVPYQEEMEKRITAMDTRQAKEGAEVPGGYQLTKRKPQPSFDDHWDATLHAIERV